MSKQPIENLFSKKIRELRLAKGVPARIVEEALGLPDRVLYKYEQGVHMPSLGRASEIARYYGSTLSEVLRDEEESQSAPQTSLTDFIELIEMFLVLLKYDRRINAIDSYRTILQAWSQVLPQNAEVKSIFQKTL